MRNSIKRAVVASLLTAPMALGVSGVANADSFSHEHTSASDSGVSTEQVRTDSGNGDGGASYESESSNAGPDGASSESTSSATGEHGDNGDNGDVASDDGLLGIVGNIL